MKSHRREKRVRESVLHTTAIVAISVGSAWSLMLSQIDSASAQTAVQSVSSQSAQGTYESGVREIVLGTTQGVNVSFLSTDEVIQRVWLNDPSRVVISFDGCLSALQAGDAGESCSFEGASIMQLRQLSQRINFPEGVTAGNGRTAFLTVITANASGQRKIYQFQLVLRGGTPPVSLIDIIPDAPPSPAQLVSVSQEYQQTILRQLSRGLAVAEARGLVDASSQAIAQLRDCISRIQSGTPFAEAMQLSNVPTSLVQMVRQLAAEGSSSSSPASAVNPSAVPVPPVLPVQR